MFLATSPAAGKVAMAVAVSPASVKGGLNAGKLVGGLAKLCGGGGGGRPNLAQAWPTSCVVSHEAAVLMSPMQAAHAVVWVHVGAVGCRRAARAQKPSRMQWRRPGQPWKKGWRNCRRWG